MWSVQTLWWELVSGGEWLSSGSADETSGWRNRRWALSWWLSWRPRRKLQPWQLGVRLRGSILPLSADTNLYPWRRTLTPPLSSQWSISFCLPPLRLTQFNLKRRSFLTLLPAQFPLSGCRASSRRQVRWMFLNAEWVRQRWPFERRRLVCHLQLFLSL